MIEAHTTPTFLENVGRDSIQQEQVLKECD